SSAAGPEHRRSPSGPGASGTTASDQFLRPVVATLYAVLTRRSRLSTRTLTPVGATFHADTDPEAFMADILFLLLGLGAFALFGLYAALLRKV
ncbi:MAG TPA: hypothetical protein PLF78_13860, partial [Caulobacter sp.]|nr:hypothetical protein [Caulobacter sp.]